MDAHDVRRQSLIELLRAQELQIVEGSDVSAIVRASSVGPDVAVVTVPSGQQQRAIEIVSAIRDRSKDVPVLLTTGQGSEELAIASLRAGVSDYLNERVPLTDLLTRVKRCLYPEVSAPTRRSDCGPLPGLGLAGERMIGQSAALRWIRMYIARVAQSDSNVLVTGETGTGKELIAELLHANSPRRRSPLIAINCAAIPDSLLESELFGHERGAFTGADARREGRLRAGQRGTVVLDEIGDMTLDAQAKLLRVIETKEVQRLGGLERISLDVRIVALTNHDLEQLVLKGKFRRDLYFRLGVVRIQLPPLRERREDIPLLADYYVREFNRVLGQTVEGFTEEAMEHLCRHDWPGNVRELRNTVEAVFVARPPRRIACSDLPAWFPRVGTHSTGCGVDERRAFLLALSATNWNKSKTAQRLRVSRMTVYRKIAKYRLERYESTLLS